MKKQNKLNIAYFVIIIYDLSAIKHHKSCINSNLLKTVLTNETREILEENPHLCTIHVYCIMLFRLIAQSLLQYRPLMRLRLSQVCYEENDFKIIQFYIVLNIK